jgi:hypothetical protein
MSEAAASLPADVMYTKAIADVCVEGEFSTAENNFYAETGVLTRCDIHKRLCSGCVIC